MWFNRTDSYQAQEVAGCSDMWIAYISYNKAMVLPQSLQSDLVVASNLHFISYQDLFCVKSYVSVNVSRIV